MNTNQNLSLRKKLERTHLLTSILSVGIFALIIIMGYFIYLQTDFVARIAGLDAAFAADEFAEIMYGDPITPALAKDYILSSGMAPIIDEKQEIYTDPEYADWLVIFDENWVVRGSNVDKIFPVGKTFNPNELFGFNQGHSIRGTYVSYSAPGKKVPYQYAASGDSHYGLAKMVDWKGDDYGHVYLRAAYGYELITSQNALLFIAIFVLGSGLAALILSGLFGKHQAKQIGYRLDELSHVSAALAAGDFSTRAPEDMDDEIGMLAKQVNQMADQISAQMQQLQAEISEREYLQNELERLARTDGLTALYNRRHFLHLAELIMDETGKTRMPVSVMMMDLDHFKQINDCYGHVVGDQVLKTFGTYIQSMMRKTDVCGRYGGEEFVCILPGINCDQGFEIAERVRENTIHLKKHFPEAPLAISVSIGVSCMDWNRNDSVYDLIDQADQALYIAKQNGRNRTEMYTKGD